MGLCIKCRKFLPPQLLTQVEGGKLCLFCEVGKDEIPVKDRVVKKTDIILEYDLFMKVVKEKNDILKKAMRGDTSGIPTKILDD